MISFEIMKKALCMVLMALAVVLPACKDKVTTQYTIGCLGVQSNAMSDSQWGELEDYFQSTVEYNKLVSFEGGSLSENDAQARKFYAEQMEKVDTAYVCSLMSGSDYFIYGIATLTANSGYRFVQAVKFEHSGVSEVQN